MAVDKKGAFTIFRNLSGGLATRNSPLVIENDAPDNMQCPILENAEMFEGGSIGKRLGKTLKNTAPINSGFQANGLYDFHVSTTGVANQMGAADGELTYNTSGTSWTQLSTGYGSNGNWSFATLSDYLISCDYGNNIPQLWNSVSAYTISLGYSAIPSTFSFVEFTSGGTLTNGVYQALFVTTLISGGYRAVVYEFTIASGPTSKAEITFNGAGAKPFNGGLASNFGFDINALATTVFLTLPNGTVFYELPTGSVNVGNPFPNNSAYIIISAPPTGAENTTAEAYTQPQNYFTDQIQPPLAQFSCIFQNMVILNDPANPCRIWYSSGEQPNIWSTLGAYIGGGYYDLDINDGEFITGIGVWNGRLYVFKRHTAWIGTFTGNNSNPIRFDPLPCTFGCLSHWTIKDLGAQGLFRLTDGGPRVFLGSYDMLAPGASNILDRFNPSDTTCYNLSLMNQSTAARNPNKNQVHITVADNGATSLNGVLVYDYEKQIFWENDQDAAILAEILDSNYIKRIWSADFSSYVYQEDLGLDDNGNAIAWSFSTPLLQFGDPFYVKNLARVYVAGVVQTSGILYCDVYIDNAASPAVTLNFDMTNANFKSGQLLKCGYKGKMFQLVFRNNTKDIPCQIEAIGLDWIQETREY